MVGEPLLECSPISGFADDSSFELPADAAQGWTWAEILFGCNQILAYSGKKNGLPHRYNMMSILITISYYMYMHSSH